MKLKILTVALALAGNIYIYGAYAVGVTCFNCTDPNTNVCTSYGSTCCAPCNGGGAVGSGCTDCDSTDWAPTGTAGYESRINAVCALINGQCTKTTLYRCAAGYYGKVKSLGGLSGCTRCPSSGGVYGTNTAGENEDITSCCIPANRTMTDSGGTFTFTDKCCYSN